MSKRLFILFLFLFLIFSCGEDDAVCDPECESWQTCNSESVCVVTDGRCESNSDCTESETCNTTTHNCESDTPECTTNTDCTNEDKPICDNGVCVAGGTDAPFHLLVTADEYHNGDTINIPAGLGDSSLALFSEYPESFGLLNDSDQSITINSITLNHSDGVMDEEFTLENSDRDPLELSDLVIETGGRLDFNVRFYPVASHDRFTTMVITYNGDQTFSVELKGIGRDDANFSTNSTTTLNKVLGGANLDEMISGSVVDGDGNTYFYGHVTEVTGADNFAFDLFYGKISSNGDLAWLKLWNGPYRDYSNDPGQNGETGGASSSIGIDSDGNIYLTGGTSPSTTNNNFAAFLIKVNGSDGSTLWQKLWRPKWDSSILAWHNAIAYSIDIKDDYIYLTGATLGEAAVMVLVFNKADGTLHLNKAIDVIKQVNDRGYCIKINDNGDAYIGGSANSRAFIMKLSSINTEPTVEWVKSVDAGLGSNINSIDLDQSGNIYAAVDVRGAATSFAFIKISPDGNLLWGKEVPSSNDSNNIHIVKVLNDKLYAGGRVGISAYDVQMGDGYLVRTTLDGTIDWSMFYYSGKGPDEIFEYRVKGIDLVNNSLHIVGQIYTGTLNGYRYSGYWYNGFNDLLVDYTPSLTDIILPTGDEIVDHIDLPDAAIEDATIESVDMPFDQGEKSFSYQDAEIKNDGYMPDADLSFIKLQLD